MKSVFLCLLLCCALVSPAQFNDSVHHYLRYSLTGIYNRTNDDRSFVINNAASFIIKRKKVDFNSYAAWIYGQQSGTLTNNDVSAGLNVDFLKSSRRLYYWALANFISSYSLNVNHQAQVGAGLGYNIRNSPNLELVVSDGLLYENSDLETDQGTRDWYQTVRNSLRFKHKWIISKIFSLEGSHFWQPSLQNSKDYIIRSTTGVSLKLQRWLSLATSVTYNRISRTDRENLLINFGVTAETYIRSKRPRPPAAPLQR